MTRDGYSNQKPTAGVLPAGSVRPAAAPIDPAIVKRLLQLEDLSSSVSDILDMLGVRSAVPATLLRPTMVEARIVGAAVTVRNVPHRLDPHAAASRQQWSMAEVEGIQQARPGEVLVIQGLAEISNMGGIMATLAQRELLAGAVVDGGVRDIAHSRRIGFPIWARDFTPVTGKWRCVTEEVNGPVTVGGATVHAGDLVVADETGICFVPHHLIEDVLVRAEELARKEVKFNAMLTQGASIPDFVRQLYPATR